MAKQDFIFMILIFVVDIESHTWLKSALRLAD